MEELEKKEEKNETEEVRPKKRMDFRLELALFFILGFLLGVVIKTEASKRITIGFNDNEIASLKQAYDFENIKEEIALVQNDIDDIEQLKQQEALIKDKQKLVQNLEEKSVNIYAILINLGANTVDDVALTDLKIKDGEIFLKGRARNYQNIAVYKEKLSEIRFFQTSEIGEIKINTEDNLLDFTMKIVMR